MCRNMKGLSTLPLTWTSPNHKAYVAFTVHFEHEGSLMSMLLDLIEVVKSHSGVNLAEAFANILEEFGIKDKVSSRLNNQILVDLLHVSSFQILSITCDNTSNNNTMVEHLATLGPLSKTSLVQLIKPNASPTSSILWPRAFSIHLMHQRSRQKVIP